MITVTMKILGNKVKQFHEIVCATGGRYTKNGSPAKSFDSDNSYKATVEFDSSGYAEFNRRWSQCVTPIIEVDSPWYKRIFRMFKGRV